MHAWTKAHAYELGLSPDAGTVDLEGMHVAFQTAVDGQPRPLIIAQIVQRREDLETGADANTRTRMYAGCTLIANVDGTVAYVVSKPLPLPDEQAIDQILDPEIASYARQQHQAGAKRLDAMRAWAEHIEDDDPLAAWLTEPSLARLTFANLHGSNEED